MFPKFVIINLICCTIFFLSSSGQDAVPTDKLTALQEKYTNQVESKISKLQERLSERSLKVLKRFSKKEAALKRKLAATDTASANRIFGDVSGQYNKLEQQLQQPQKLTQYIPALDTLKSSVGFLGQLNPINGEAKEKSDQLKTTMSKFDGLQNELGKADAVKKYLRERKEYLKQQLSGYGFTKELTALNKEVYYYQQQVREYKEMLKDPKKIERKALELLTKTKIFQDFITKNGMMASLFGLPGNEPDPGNLAANLAGLQTRTAITQTIQREISSGGPNAMSMVQQNMQAAQSQLDQLKSKFGGNGGGSGDMEIPDFKPNTQRTKTFLQRLELGTNLQSQSASYYFPSTSDIGLSVGYKLNEKSTIGIGGSYKLGLGQNWQHINFTNQGVGLRSFLDYRIRGSFFMAGGYELNYRTEFRRIEQLNSLSAWQQSGLVGISKIVSLKTKVLKKTKVQCLFDFLYNQQVPRTQPFIIRAGYAF
jgi:hypothetical protein